ncbi:MAG TPA: hypothetical protein PLF11_12570 [Bacillota bacterium]|nr:hypothetical protein [Bacillota bacterium]
MTDPSKSLLVSSVDCDLSFTEQRIAEAQRNGERQKVTVTNPWLAQPAGTFSDKTFFVFTGTDESDPAGPPRRAPGSTTNPTTVLQKEPIYEVGLNWQGWS